MILHGIHGCLLHIPPELHDMRIGCAPVVDQTRQFLLGQAHIECPHTDQGSSRPAVAAGQLRDLSLLSQLAIDPVLDNGHSEHL